LLVSIDVAHVEFSNSPEREAQSPLASVRVHGKAA
jgi:hypothetical protein